MSDDEPSLSFTATYDDGVQTEGITLLIWVKEISSGSQGISSRSATCSTAFPKFNFVKGTIHHTLAAAAGTACFHKKGCLLCNYRLQENFQSYIYLLLCMCVALPIFWNHHHVPSWRDHLCLVKQHIWWELFLLPCTRKVPWLEIPESICLSQECVITLIVTCLLKTGAA